MYQSIPAEFNAKSYRKNNPDVPDLRRKALRQHWQKHGFSENRTASIVSNRMEFLNLCLGSCKRLLEIGPFDRPSLEKFRKPETVIEYADYLDTNELRERARISPNRNPETVPEINYCLAKGFVEIQSKYDAVVSHHCVEHQPDLIGHFLDVFSVLANPGIYAFTVPHKDLCFDHFIPESSYLDAVVAHLERRTKPTLRSVIETRCFTRHNYKDSVDPFSHATQTSRRCIDRAQREYLAMDYVDVHCWQFTPLSLKRMLHNLSVLGFLPETEVRIFCLGPEFGCVIWIKNEEDTAKPALC